MEPVTSLLLKINPCLINEKDECGSTALHMAALRGHQTLLEILLGNGADIAAHDDEGINRTSYGSIFPGMAG